MVEGQSRNIPYNAALTGIDLPLRLLFDTLATTKIDGVLCCRLGLFRVLCVISSAGSSLSRAHGKGGGADGNGAEWDMLRETSGGRGG